MHNDFIAGCADALFVSAWADAHERAGNSFAPGTEILDVAPKTPACLELYAKGLLVLVQALSGNRQIEDVFYENTELDGHYATPTRYTFGWYIGMEFLGHGVSWSDDHPKHGLHVPKGEVNVDLSATGKTAHITASPASLSATVRLMPRPAGMRQVRVPRGC